MLEKSLHFSTKQNKIAAALIEKLSMWVTETALNTNLHVTAQELRRERWQTDKQTSGAVRLEDNIQYTRSQNQLRYIQSLSCCSGLFLPHTDRCLLTQASARIWNLQQDDTRGKDDAVTVITVISAAVITSILFAFKRH